MVVMGHTISILSISTMPGCMPDIWWAQQALTRTPVQVGLALRVVVNNLVALPPQLLNSMGTGHRDLSHPKSVKAVITVGGEV
jgi:hypothetical protein